MKRTRLVLLLSFLSFVFLIVGLRDVNVDCRDCHGLLKGFILKEVRLFDQSLGKKTFWGQVVFFWQRQQGTNALVDTNNGTFFDD